MSVEVLSPPKIDTEEALQNLDAAIKIGEIVSGYSCMMPPCVDPARCSAIDTCIQAR